jgi:uncharacterized protein YxjI
MTNPHDERFQRPYYTIRSKFFRIFGDAFHLYDDQGDLVLYSEMKRFRLREDIRLYADESMNDELLRINTRSIFDFSGAYDVVDSRTEERVGTLRRSGFKSSFLQDHWTILDPEGNEIGTLEEDSMVKALVRRYLEILSIFLPQRYHASLNGRTVASYQQRFNPVILKLDLDFSADPEQQLDRRLGLAAGVLLSAIEGRQE